MLVESSLLLHHDDRFKLPIALDKTIDLDKAIALDKTIVLDKTLAVQSNVQKNTG